MTLITYLIAAFVAVATDRGAQYLWQRYKPFVVPYYAALAARPGAVVLDLMETDGRVVASLVLKQINWQLGGPTAAEFVDKTYFLERKRFDG